MPYTSKYPVFDGHIHIMQRFYDLDGFMADIKRLIEGTGILGFTSQCTSAYKLRSGQAPAQVLAKALNPGKVFINGGFSYNLDGLPFDRAGMLAQIQTMYDAGFDGLKMLEGKPTVRKETGIPLDSEIYADAFAFCEEKNIHVLCHVADPWTFWDVKECPQEAYKYGWAYIDGSYVQKEALHSEVDRVLKRHPKLNLTLPHFYFLAYDLERMGDFFDRNPTVSTDLCPNPYLFYDLQKDIDKSRDFFIKYQDRIFFGTDNEVNDGHIGEAAVTHANKNNADIFRFLELSEEYDTELFSVSKLHGIGLDGEPLKKIYKDNYMRIKGPHRELNMGKAIEFCEKRLWLMEKNFPGTDTPMEGVKHQIREVIVRLKDMA